MSKKYIILNNHHIEFLTALIPLKPLATPLKAAHGTNTLMTQVNTFTTSPSFSASLVHAVTPNSLAYGYNVTSTITKVVQLQKTVTPGKDAGRNDIEMQQKCGFGKSYIEYELLFGGNWKESQRMLHCKHLYCNCLEQFFLFSSNSPTVRPHI